MNKPRRSTGTLLLENNGPGEGWAIITEQGKIINPPITSTPCLAYYLKQHELASRVSNLDALECPHLVQIAKARI